MNARILRAFIKIYCGDHMIAAFVLGLCLSSLLLPGCATRKLPDTASGSQQTKSTTGDQFDDQRRRMVEEQIRARGIKNNAVLDAMMKVPRHRFVPAKIAHSAYHDNPLPIGQGQTISQPYIVAYMSEAAEISKSDKVLEIGTGSGYQAAILGELAKEVYTIEILPELAERARQTLSELGYKNVNVKTGNGYEGWAEHAPYDAIVVTAAPDKVPQALVDQLAVNGTMVIPVGQMNQDMMIITKTPQGVIEKRTIPVRFVPMTGKPQKQS
jgi:protein-L-isoaspartate(D-aspartate) O-methyltransferase